MSVASQLRRLIPLGLGGAALATFVATTAPVSPGDPPIDRIVPIAQQATAQAICDIDGVDVSYHTTYRSDPTHGYDVVDVVVSDVSWPTCAPARLRVELTVVHTDSTVEVGSAEIPKLSVPVSGTVVDPIEDEEVATITMPVRIDPPSDDKADAAEAMRVAVELEGGMTPVPDDCLGMKFNKIQVGTLGDDTLTGTNPAGDLIYGLQGVDTITSLQGNDCIHTEASDTGNDTVTLGNGTNVVSTGAGHDVISVGNGSKNKISAGDGDDDIYVGNGKSNEIDGGDGANQCFVPKSVKVISITRCQRIDT